MGGIAGLNDRLVLFDNGEAIISSGIVTKEILLNQTDMDKITTVFTTAQFSMLEGNYTGRRGSSDLIHYTISFHNKIVNTEDSVTPPQLLPVIDELNRILRTGEGTAPINPFANIPT
jgi:hypothetical protein